jgi:heme/copper-type cytochrome/quinol oxidase subunit 2
MRAHKVPSQSAEVPGRALTALGALAVALGAAFVLAPGRLAAKGSERGFAEQHNLVDALRPAFVEYWRSGDRAFPPDLQRVVDYWFRFHVVKAVLAAALLIVFVVLGVLLWKAFLRSNGPVARGRVALASVAVVVSVLALVSLAAAMANVQGAIAPFSSLTSMLPLGAPGGQLTGAVEQIRQGLADYPDTGGQNAVALRVMVDDFGLYHEVIAVLASIVAVALIGLSVMAWRGFAAAGASGDGAVEGRTRRTMGWFGVLSALLALAVIVVAVANTGTAADPAPALLDFYRGGW